MISAREALTTILNSVPLLGCRSVSLHDSAGCFLAEDIIATESLPSFDSSGMDGFAVRYEDTLQVPVRLRISGEIAAGTVPGRMVGAGEAIKIATGAKIPGGCTAVVQKEWCELCGDGEVTILRRPTAGAHIRKAGADVSPGTVVISGGTLIGPRETGVLAALGLTTISVVRPPSVAVCSTGSELVGAGETPGPAQIRDSNRPLCTALLEALGCVVIDLGIAQDDPVAIENVIRKGLQADCLITSGGVSVGDYDLVAGILERAGVSILFRKINIKPGMPMLFGLKAATPVFGLPGNPVSTFVTWHQFVRPALRKMMGDPAPDKSRRVHAIVTERLAKSDGKRHFIRGMLGEEDGRLTVRTTGSQLSNIQTSIMKADCFIILPEDVTEVAAGEIVDVEIL
jgi:molybdopterin molybdotransferase